MRHIKHFLLSVVLCGFVINVHGLENGYALSDTALIVEETSQDNTNEGNSDDFYEIDAIKNGGFDLPNQKSGWTDGVGEMDTGNHNNWTNVNGGFVEKWTSYGAFLSDMDFYQEIDGLPSGTYRFAVYVVACQQSLEDSHEVNGVKIYANTDSVSVHTINVDRDAANHAIGKAALV